MFRLHQKRNETIKIGSDSVPRFFLSSDKNRKKPHLLFYSKFSRVMPRCCVRRTMNPPLKLTVGRTTRVDCTIQPACPFYAINCPCMNLTHLSLSLLLALSLSHSLSLSRSLSLSLSLTSTLSLSLALSLSLTSTLSLSH